MLTRVLTNAEIDGIEHRHKHHPPSTKEVAQAHERVRRLMIEATKNVLECLPEKSRETALFLTKMDEARMWANAAVACNQQPASTTPEPSPVKSVSLSSDECFTISQMLEVYAPADPLVTQMQVRIQEVNPTSRVSPEAAEAIKSLTQNKPKN